MNFDTGFKIITHFIDIFFKIQYNDEIHLEVNGGFNNRVRLRIKQIKKNNSHNIHLWINLDMSDFHVMSQYTSCIYDMDRYSGMLYESYFGNKKDCYDTSPISVSSFYPDEKYFELFKSETGYTQSFIKFLNSKRLKNKFEDEILRII